MLFLSKINYKVQDHAGKWKSYGEQFLHEAITYAEVETQLATCLDGRVKDYTYDISKARFYAVYEPFLHASFYKVTVEEEEENIFGVTKKTTKVHLVVADDVPTAEARCRDYMKSWVNPGDIIGADKTKILGYWHPKNQQWMDDFKERMLALAELGQESNDANQTTIFDADGNPKRYDTDAESKDVDLDQFTDAAAAYQARTVNDAEKDGEPPMSEIEAMLHLENMEQIDDHGRALDEINSLGDQRDREQLKGLDLDADSDDDDDKDDDDLDTLGDGTPETPKPKGPKKNISFLNRENITLHPGKPGRRAKTKH